MKLSACVAVVLVSCIVALAAQAQPQDQVVAEAGDGYEITIGDLKEYLDGRPDVLYGLPREEAYRQALDHTVTEALKQIDFFKRGLHHDDEFLQRNQRVITEELTLAYGKTQYEDRYLNEKTIRAEHEAMGRVVVYRQLILNKPPGASQTVLDSLRATVNRIQQQLEDGIPFETLVRRYSEDNATAQRGGAATPVTWEQSHRNPYADILFHLAPGEVRSFEGPKRFAVARIERVEQVPAPPLDEVREQIVRTIQGRHAAEATRAFRREWMALVDTTTLRWNADALKQVVAWSNTPGFYEGAYRRIIPQYLAEHDDALVLSDLRGGVRLSDLPQLFDEVLTLSGDGDYNIKYIQDFLLEAVRTKRLADRARMLGLEDTIMRADTPSPALANAFVRFYNQKYIEARIPEPTEAALRDFYEAYDDSLFYQLARVNTEIIVRSDKDEIEALWDEVQQGVAFEEVSSRRLIRSFERTRDGEIVTRYTRGDHAPASLGEVAFGLAEGEVAPPVAYNDPEKGQLYAIILATRRLEERQLTFDEVRDRVAEAFVEHHRARIAAEVATDLRDRYPVTIHHTVLDQVLAESR